MCDDLLHLIVQGVARGATPLERLEAMLPLSMLSKRFRSVVKAARPKLLEAAAHELVSSTGSRAYEEVLNLSSLQMDTLGCEALAEALKQGLVCRHVTTVWLQDNNIGARGLRWISQGLASCQLDSLRSVSIGSNAFHAQLSNPPPELRRELDLLERVANKRRIRVRLFT